MTERLSQESAERIVFDTMRRYGYTTFTKEDITKVVVSMPIEEYLEVRRAFADWRRS